MVTQPAAPGMFPITQHTRGSFAGIVSRTAAMVIDFAIVSVVLAVTYLVFTAVRFVLRPRSFTFPAPTLSSVTLVGALAAVIYFTICWTTSGRTYGDVLLGLRVVTRRGDRLHLIVAVLRALACVIFPLGLFWCGVDRSRRSLQDVLLRTRVIYDWPEHHPPPR
jgi:uncharacterized RDD family membrane protein YckC